MSAQDDDTQPLSRGVDALIARLRDEGVSAGRAEAEELLANARSEARAILETARRDADARTAAAKREAQAFQRAGEEALKTAMRDTILELKAVLMHRFSNDMRRLVSRDMADPDLLRRMILEVAGKATADAGSGDSGPATLLLPETAVGLEELRDNPQELRDGALTGYVLGLTGAMLRDGVTLSVSDEVDTGIRIDMRDGDLSIDLSEEAVTAFLLKHLQPRFRAILEGIVK